MLGSRVDGETGTSIETLHRHCPTPESARELTARGGGSGSLLPAIVGPTALASTIPATATRPAVFTIGLPPVCSYALTIRSLYTHVSPSEVGENIPTKVGEYK